MPSQGPNYAGATQAPNWTDPANATGAPDGNYATAPASGLLQAIDLILTDFGFTIGAAQPLGVVVNIFGHATASGAVVSVALMLDGSQYGESTAMHLSMGDTWASAGASDAMSPWNVSLTDAQISQSSFGVVLSVVPASVGYSIDAVRMTVYYADFGGGSGSVGLIYGRTRTRYVDRWGKTVFQTSRRRARSLLLPDREILIPTRKAA